MVIKGQEVDYEMDKARIDASGFDLIRYEQMHEMNCEECGKMITEDMDFLNLNGVIICENCQKDSEVLK